MPIMFSSVNLFKKLNDSRWHLVYLALNFFVYSHIFGLNTQDFHIPEAGSALRHEF